MVWGLSYGTRTISLESVTQPNHYLRVHDSQLVLEPFQDDQQYKEDATFYLRPGLGNGGWASFESVCHPGYYLRHRNWNIYLDKFPIKEEPDKGPLTPGSETPPPGSSDVRFGRDATFLLTRPRLFKPVEYGTVEGRVTGFDGPKGHTVIEFIDMQCQEFYYTSTEVNGSYKKILPVGYYLVKIYGGKYEMDYTYDLTVGSGTTLHDIHIQRKPGSKGEPN